MDTLDTAAFTGRSTNESVLEGIDTIGICMYAGVGHLADMGDVIN